MPIKVTVTTKEPRPRRRRENTEALQASEERLDANFELSRLGDMNCDLRDLMAKITAVREKLKATKWMTRGEHLKNEVLPNLDTELNYLEGRLGYAIHEIDTYWNRGQARLEKGGQE